MSETVIVNIVYSGLSLLLAALSMWFVYSTLKQNTQILEQNQQQFDVSKRIENQPLFQVDPTTLQPNGRQNIAPVIAIPDEFYTVMDKIDVICKIKNVGNGPAVNIIYTLKMENQIYTDAFPTNAIQKGDEYIFTIRLKLPINDYEPFTVECIWGYDDILENSYEQKSFLHFEDGKLIYIENDFPKYLGVVGYKLA